MCPGTRGTRGTTGSRYRQEKQEASAQDTQAKDVCVAQGGVQASTQEEGGIRRHSTRKWLKGKLFHGRPRMPYPASSHSGSKDPARLGQPAPPRTAEEPPRTCAAPPPPKMVKQGS